DVLYNSSCYIFQNSSGAHSSWSHTALMRHYCYRTAFLSYRKVQKHKLNTNFASPSPDHQTKTELKLSTNTCTFGNNCWTDHQTNSNPPDSVFYNLADTDGASQLSHGARPRGSRPRGYPG